MRKLVSIQEITYIKEIPDADSIECVIIGGGWPVVVKKGDFQVGDKCVYFEIDSFLPETERFERNVRNVLTSLSNFNKTKKKCYNHQGGAALSNCCS